MGTGPTPIDRNELGAPTPADNQDDIEPAHAGQDDVASPAVTPQAPFDVRLLDAVREVLEARPRWSERAPAMAETWKHSTTGDWTVEENSIKRFAHGALVLIIFVVTYPLEWWIQVVRQKPIGFVLTLAVLFVLSQVL